jgi:hypothetical protein
LGLRQQHWGEDIAWLQGMGDSVLVTRNQGKELLQDRLRRERILVDHLISPNLGKILGFGNIAGVANYGSKESVELLGSGDAQARLNGMQAGWLAARMTCGRDNPCIASGSPTLPSGALGLEPSGAKPRLFGQVPRVAVFLELRDASR